MLLSVYRSRSVVLGDVDGVDMLHWSLLHRATMQQPGMAN